MEPDSWRHGGFYGLVATWFASSVVTEVADSIVMKRLGAPLTLALWKFLISIPCGLASVHVAQLKLPSCTIAIAKRTAPLALMIVLGKLFTYISYGHVPLSTAQVAKAATPVVTVLMARAVLGERFRTQSYLALIPIVLGVWLGVGIGLDDFGMIGILAALASCMMAAAQGVYMKTIFRSGSIAPSLPPLTLNLLVACCCVGLLLPVWLAVQFGVVPADIDGGKLVLSRRRRIINGDAVLFAFLFGGVSQYVQSACAYLVIAKVSPATSAVIGTARKPFIVVGSLILFAVPVSLLNVIGIVLTFGGTAWYNCVTDEEQSSATDGKAAARRGERDAMISPATLTLGEAAEGHTTDEDADDGARPSVLNAFGAWYEAQLVQQPMLVKVVTSGVLWGVGDLLGQILSAWHVGLLTGRHFDVPRFIRSLVYGGVLYAPVAHAHSNLLEWLLGSKRGMTGARATVVKVVVEQFVFWSYFSNAYYHVMMGALQGHGVAACIHGLADNFVSTLIAQWALWLPAQTIQFRYVPVRHQLGFVLFCSLVWSTFLSAAYPPSRPAPHAAPKS